MLINPIKKYENIFVYIILAMLCLWPIIFLNKGIDIIDSAYYLGNYKNFFSDTYVPTIITEHTFLLGAIFYKILPSAKYISFRMLDIIFNALSWLMCYKVMKDKMDKIWLSLAMLVGSFTLRRYPMFFSYNTVSIFFIMLSIYILNIALKKEKIYLTCLSGFIIGINVFSRIPNILSCFLVFVPFIYAVFKKDKKAFKHTLLFTIFGFAGLFLSIAICIMLEGKRSFYFGIQDLIILSSTGSHTGSYMKDRIVFEMKSAFLYLTYTKKFFAIFTLLTIVSSIVYTRVKTNKALLVLFFINIAYCVVFARYIGNNIYDREYNYLSAFLCYILSLVALALSAKNSKDEFINLLSIFIFVIIIPIGTDNGLMQYSIAGVLVFSLIIKSLNMIINSFKKEKIKRFFSFFITSFAMLIILSFGKAAYSNILFDLSYQDKAYADQKYSVNIDSLKYMKTYKEKADALNSLYSIINSDKYKDKKVLYYDNHVLPTLSNHENFYHEVWKDFDMKYENIKSYMTKENNYPILVFSNIAPMVDTSVLNQFEDTQKDLVNKDNYTIIKEKYYVLLLPNN